MPRTPRHQPAVRRRLLSAFCLAIIALVLLTAATHQGRVAIKAALLLPQLFPNTRIRPQEWLTPPPLKQEISYPIDEEERVAYLYLPRGSPRHGALVIYTGIVRDGPEDPRVVGLANALARAGVVVMVVPGSERTTDWRIDPQEPANLVATFQYLRNQDFVDSRRVGMAGFCVGASLVLMAAADPRIADEVALVNSFGGYYNGLDLVKSIASQTRFYSGHEEPWKPDPFSKQVIANEIIDSLSQLNEQTLLRQATLENQPPTSAELEGLSPEALAAYRLLENPTLAEADALVPRLPPSFRQNLMAISPSRVVGDLRARILIMHDREDASIPSEESRRLAEALANRGNVHYTEFSFFDHVDPTRRVGPLTFLHEAEKLFLHIYNILLVVA